MMDGFRLSPQQRRLWRFQGSGVGPYRVRAVVRVDGPLAPEELRSALDALAAENEILRTTLQTLPGLGFPLQALGDSTGVDLRVGKEEAEAAEAGSARKPLEVRWLPPAGQGDAGAELVLTFSSFHADAATPGLLTARLAELLRGAPPAAGSGPGEDGGEEQPLQYIDIAEWQNELLESPETEEGADFWRRELDGFEVGSGLPWAARSELGAFHPCRESRPVSGERLRRWASHGAAAGDFLLAAWTALLARLTGEPEGPAVAVADEGRSYAELAAAPGPLRRFLPLRVETAPGQDLRDLPFIELLAKVREHRKTLAGRAHFYPGLPEAAPGKPSFLPFAFEELELPATFAAGAASLTLESVRADGEPYHLCLSLESLPSGEGRLTLAYDGARHQARDAAVLLDQLETLADAAGAEPESPVRELPLAGADEIALLTGETARGPELPGTERRLEEVFAETAARYPDAVAVAEVIRPGDGSGEMESQISFGALAARVRRLAGELARRGVGPETVVGIRLPRSAAQVEALLAVLTAGGVYLPLDPAYPEDRLREMAADSGAALLLTTAEGRRVFADAGSAEVLELSALLDAAPERGSEPPAASKLGPEGLAYILYTSGSTGRPKGVMMSHRAIANRVLWMPRRFDFRSDDRFLQRTPQSFDASLWEIFAPLVVGGRLVLADDVREPHRLAATLKERRITVMQLVPTLLRLALSSLDGAGDGPVLGDLRFLFCGGEVLSPELAETFLEGHPAAELHNLYGPTEGAIDTTHHACRRGGARRGIPIGRPLPGVEAHVLGPDLRPAAIGIPGELFAGGVQLARGYRGRPGQTAERFVPHPGFASGAEGARLYRTGDLVRRRPDGALSYLGRIDSQVKVSGVRVEPGEVEAVVAEHPRVLEAAVAALPARDGEGYRLAAYVVLRAGGGVDIRELRLQAARRLPEAMVPTSWRLMEELPRTPSGKLDRGRLPSPEDDEAGARAAYVPPETPEEEALATIWARILDRERVGRNDDFFELGGDSILGLQLVALAGREGITLTAAQVFEHPRLADLASVAEGASAAGGGAEAVPEGGTEPTPLVPAEERALLAERFPDLEDAYPAAPVQEGILFESLLAEAATGYISQMSWVLEGDIEPEHLRRALQASMDRHPTLRGAFVWEGLPGPRQVVLAGLEMPWRELDWRGLSPDEQKERFEELWREDRGQGFDPARPPLIRVSVARLAEHRFHMLMSHHHLLLDGWSMAVLFHELETQLDAVVGGAEEAELPPAVPYRRFLEWLAARDGEVVAEQEAFWSRQVRGLREAPDLGVELAAEDSAAVGPGFGTVTLELTADETAALRRLARSRRLTFYPLVQAAWALVLARYTGREEVCFGSTSAGRPSELVGIDEIIGLFINTVPVRLRVPPLSSAGEWLDAIQQLGVRLREADLVPLSRIQALSDLPRGRRLFNTIVVFENTPFTEAGRTRVAERIRVTEPRMLTPNHYPFTLHVSPRERLYMVALFDRTIYRPETAERLLNEAAEVLRALVSQPDARLDELAPAVGPERRATVSDDASSPFDSPFSPFGADAPQPVAVTQEELVRRRPPAEGSFPLVIEPAMDDVDLAEWAREHREEIEADLFEHGTVIFRGFGMATAEELTGFAEAVCDELFEGYGDLPTPEEGTRVYGATPYPEERTILFHNEASHTPRWPLKQMFLCVVRAEEGGESVLADGREVYRRLRPELRRRFEEKGLSYVRNFTDRLDVPWREFFRTDDREEVEERCRRSGVECRWHGEDNLRIQNRAPAVAEHPVTGDAVWFNQIQLHHVSCIDPETRASLENLFAADELPRNVYFGDGEVIPDEVVDEVGRVLEECSVEVLMEEGDLILVDNMRVAHCRKPYRGPRKVLVAMGDTMTSRDLREKARSEPVTTP